MHNIGSRKGGQVGTTPLYSNCRACHYNACVIFELNNKPLHTKNDSE